MFPADTIAAVQEWEARFPVRSWTYDGLHAWPFIRIQLASAMWAAGQNRLRSMGAVGAAANEAMEAVRTVAARVRDWRSNVRGAPPSDVLFLSSPTNRQILRGEWYDRFFDPIADILAERSLSSSWLEYHYNGTRYRLPRHRPSALIRPAVFRERVKASLRRRPSVAGAFEGYEEFARCVRERAPEVTAPTPGQVTARLREIARIADWFEKILARAAPRLALCTYYYSFIGMAFCLAASRRGVRSVDVQHGVTLQNPAYEGWTQFPPEGYALLPDVFWSWTHRDARPVTDWPEEARPHHRALVVGHPWVAHWEADDELASEYIGQIDAIRGPSLNVLVSLAWSSGLSDRLEAILRKAPPEWTWWIRLHPTMDAERRAIRSWCAHNAGDRVHVDLPSDLPLPLLLQQADVHLTHNSTVIQEATASRVPTVAIDPAALDVYVDEFASGWARFSSTTTETIAALEEQSRKAEGLPSHGAYPSRVDMARAVFGLLDQSAPDDGA